MDSEQGGEFVDPAQGGHHDARTFSGREMGRCSFRISLHERGVDLAIADSGIQTHQAGTRFEERFGPLRALMRTLDLVTLAGQQHVMNTMLLSLRGEVLRLESPVSASDLATLSNVMVDLERPENAGPSASFR